MRSAGRFAALLALCLLSASGPCWGATDSDGRQIHTVYPGQTLGKIAKRYRVSVEALCRVNRIRYGASIRPGQRLVVPNGEDDSGRPPAARGAGDKWQDYALQPPRRGFVVLESPTKKWRGYVLSRRGRPLPKARDAIERMFASWRTGTEHPIDDRLIRLVVNVSDAFGGRPIRIVSGYREHSFAVESKHKIGRAFDFSIPGIPNALTRDYLRTLPKVGVGYYPNSTHVHLDVRDESAYWVDESAPGEAPRYAHAGVRGETEPTTDSAPADDTGDQNRVE